MDLEVEKSYDIFIENLKILSDSYREYLEKLQLANKTFVDKYPHKIRKVETFFTG
ncbi:hypothetical protein [Clostridium isatidis]|uniref:hypothetical protein n=1 Tax=Clostridium isatidis TaxID=182773 RepID=UPI003AB02DD5